MQPNTLGNDADARSKKKEDKKESNYLYAGQFLIFNLLTEVVIFQLSFWSDDLANVSL